MPTEGKSQFVQCDQERELEHCSQLSPFTPLSSAHVLQRLKPSLYASISSTAMPLLVFCAEIQNTGLRYSLTVKMYTV